MTPADIVNLVTQPGISGELGENLYKQINREPGYFPAVIDFFIHTGGRTSGPAMVYIGYLPDGQEEIRKEAGSSQQKIIFVDDLLAYSSKRGTQPALADKFGAARLSAAPKRK